jgi:hypothetical protein
MLREKVVDIRLSQLSWSFRLRSSDFISLIASLYARTCCEQMHVLLRLLPLCLRRHLGTCSADPAADLTLKARQGLLTLSNQSHAHTHPNSPSLSIIALDSLLHPFTRLSNNLCAGLSLQRQQSLLIRA